MTKHDWIWVAIRIFGIYLIVQAIVAVPSLFSSALAIWMNQFSINSDHDQGFTRTLHSALNDEFLSALAKFVVCGSIGFYFIKGGGFLFKILCPPDPANTQKPDA